MKIQIKQPSKRKKNEKIKKYTKAYGRGAKMNEENTYWIIVSKTKEKLQGFRTRWTALQEVNRWEKITFEECEVV